MATTLGALNPFRYRGYVYDEETGFYYLKSRYYDPETFRLISADVLLSTGQGVIGHNCYVYCLNNPIIFVGFHGLRPSIDDVDPNDDEIDNLLNNTNIERSTATYSNVEYITYTISIKSDLLTSYSTDYSSLLKAAKEYSHRVYGIIKSRMETEKKLEKSTG